MAKRFFMTSWAVVFVLFLSAVTASAETIAFRASWYGPGFHGRRMANGQRFDMHTLVVAHPSLPFGTCLEIVNPHNSRTVRVIVKDRGPYIHGRNLDVSYRVAQVLDFVDTGVIELRGRLCT